MIFDDAHPSRSSQFPMGSAVQQVAMQCWCLTFQPQDHSFLIQSNVFANISKALSGVDGAEESEGTKIKNKVVVLCDTPHH